MTYPLLPLNHYDDISTQPLDVIDIRSKRVASKIEVAPAVNAGMHVSTASIGLPPLRKGREYLMPVVASLAMMGVLAGSVILLSGMVA